MAQDATQIFEQHRGPLVGVAYRMVGQMADAEDIVQEAWLRWSTVETTEVDDPRAYLIRITTRLAIDRLRHLKARREDYVGEWLPEPIPTQTLASLTTDPGEAVVLGETLSMAMLVILETLSPLERAVFILREAFGYAHAEIAETLGRSEVAVRQLAARAKRHVDARQSRFERDPMIVRDVTQRFLAASREGDIDSLMRLLAPDVEFIADGGGLARAPLRPVLGADRVVRFLVASGGRMTPDQRMALADLNGSPAIISYEGQSMIAAATLELDGGRIQRILLVANPQKLGSIRP